MSSHRLFSIIGDANVRRNMTGLNVASRLSMKSAQVIDCVLLSSLAASLQEVKNESQVVIVASITEFLLFGIAGGTVAAHIDPILASFSSLMNSFCSTRPTTQVRLNFIAVGHFITETFGSICTLKLVAIWLLLILLTISSDPN